MFFVLVALLWGTRGATLAALVGALIAIAQTVRGLGPFIDRDGLFGDTALNAQGYAAALAMTGLLVATLVEGQRVAASRAREWKTRFEAAIGAHGLIAYEWAPESGELVVSGDTTDLVGLPAQKLATLADWLACVAPQDRDAVAARFGERGAGGAADTMRYAVFGPSGTSTVIDEARAIHDHDGDLHRIVGIVRATPVRMRRRAAPRHEARAGFGHAAAQRVRFLIHGLGGTQYDLGSMHKRLKNAGLVTYSLTLPGHGTKPEDLASVAAEDWVEAVVAKYREIRDQHPTLHLMGMCMGSLLAALLAERERHAKGNLIMLAPPVYIDGWATPWYRFLRPVLYAVPGLPRRMKIEEEDPFGIKNEQLRAIVKAKFRARREFPLPVGAAGVHPPGRPLACDGDESRVADPLPDAGGARA